MICDTCGQDTGPTTYILHGPIGTHILCAYCHDGIERPASPELIHETFGIRHRHPNSTPSWIG